VDFGIAGLSDGRKSEITNAGSLNYMPPEIFLRKNVGASPALDIWALGCILYTLVVGKLPFSGPKSSDVKNMIINDEVFFPKKLVLTDEIKDLILKMMTKEPEKRIIMHEIMDHPWIRRKKFTQEQRDELKIKFPDNLPNELPEIKEVKESPKASMDKSAPKKSMSYFPNAKKPITSFGDDPKNKKPKK
jgi:serine/threonine protein kinase